MTFAQVARAFRWYGLSIFGATLDFSDVVPASNFAGLPKFKTPREAAALEQILIQAQGRLRPEYRAAPGQPDSAER